MQLMGLHQISLRRVCINEPTTLVSSQDSVDQIRYLNQPVAT